jgi:hypothetical protein
MKTIKAKTHEELKEKIKQTRWFRSVLKRRIEVKYLINKLETKGEYVGRDLKEELSSLEGCMKLDYAGERIRRGCNNNKPFIYNWGGHSCITSVHGYFKGEFFSFLTFSEPEPVKSEDDEYPSFYQPI